MESNIYALFDTAIKIGLGAVISGVATYFVTRQKNREDAKRDKQNWLRENKYLAYQKLSRCIMSWGVNDDKVDSAFDYFSLLSECALLTDNKSLVDDLNSFLHQLEKVSRYTDSGEPDKKQKAEKLYYGIYDQRLVLVSKLREDLSRV